MITDSTLRYSEIFVKLLNELPTVERLGYSYHLFVGKRYDKIIENATYNSGHNNPYVSTSAFAFVNPLTGELIKPNSWSQPSFNRQGKTRGKYFINTDEGMRIALYNANKSIHGFLYQDYPIEI